MSSVNAVSANSTANSPSNSNTSNASKVSKKKQRPKQGKFETRAGIAHARKLELFNAYKKLLRVIKLAEMYYADPLPNNKQAREKLTTNAIKNIINTSKISKVFNHLPSLDSKMTNEEINEIIKKQKTKMKQGVLRGLFPPFREKTEELARLQKQNAPNTKEREILKKMRNELLIQHSNLKNLKDADKFINDFFKKYVTPLKKSLERYEKKTQEMEKARDEKNKQDARLKKYRKFAMLFKARQKEIVEAKVKARKKIKANQAKQARQQAKENERTARQRAKENERTARQNAKTAEIQRKNAERAERAAMKAQQEVEKEARRAARAEKAAMRAEEEAKKAARRAAREEKAARKKAEEAAFIALKQAYIMKVGLQMTNKNLTKL